MKQTRAATEGEPSAFERFENLARKLFAVPKKELDEKLAQYEKRKVRRKTHRGANR
jgi:hypothetical protein